jgi:hypothetical protein
MAHSFSLLGEKLLNKVTDRAIEQGSKVLGKIGQSLYEQLTEDEKAKKQRLDDQMAQLQFEKLKIENAMEERRQKIYQIEELLDSVSDLDTNINECDINIARSESMIEQLQLQIKQHEQEKADEMHNKFDIIKKRDDIQQTINTLRSSLPLTSTHFETLSPTPVTQKFTTPEPTSHPATPKRHIDAPQSVPEDGTRIIWNTHEMEHGANCMYVWCSLPHIAGRIEFFSTGSSGPSHMPTHSYTLFLVFPLRKYQLNVKLSHTCGLNKKLAKDLLCGTALRYLKDLGWYDNMAYKGDIYPTLYTAQQQHVGNAHMNTKTMHYGNAHMKRDRETAEFSDEEDFSIKDDGAIRIAKRHKGKERRLRQTYSSFYYELTTQERHTFTGNFDNDMKFIFAKFVTAGYNPDSVMELHPTLVHNVLRQFIKGRGLMGVSHLIRLSRDFLVEHGKPMLTVPLNFDQPEPGKKVRQYLIDLFPSKYPNFCMSRFVKLNSTHTGTAHMFTKLKEKFDEHAKSTVLQTLKDPEVKGEMKKSAEEAGKGVIAGIMEQIKETLSGAFSGFGEGFKSAVSNIAWFTYHHRAIILGLLGLLVILVLGGIFWRFLFKTRTLSDLNFAHDFMPETYDDIKREHNEYIRNTDTQHFGAAHQNNGEGKASSDYLTWFSNTVAETFGYVAQQIKAPFLSFNMDAKRCNDYFTLFKNVEYFSTGFSKLVKAILDWIATLATGKPFFDSTAKMREWYELTSTTLINLASNDDRTVEARKAFIVDFDRVCQTSRILLQTGDLQEFHRVVKILQSLQPRYDQYKKEFSTESVRMEPVVPWFCGKPGTGKSFCTAQLPKALFDFMRAFYPEGVADIAKEYSKSLVWERKIANEFADGWHEQLFTNIDDIFVSLDPGVRYLEAMEFMAMKNDAPYMLHSADVGDKGKLYFKSRMVTVSTNLTEQDVDLGITDHNTVRRRRDFIIDTEFIGPKDSTVANTVDAFRNMRFKVRILNLKTLRHEPEVVYEGLEGWLMLVRIIAIRYKHYHQASLRKTQDIDYTYLLAANDQKMKIQYEEAQKQQALQILHSKLAHELTTNEFVEIEIDGSQPVNNSGYVETTQDDITLQTTYAHHGKAHQDEPSLLEMMKEYYINGDPKQGNKIDTDDVESLLQWQCRTGQTVTIAEPMFTYTEETDPTKRLGGFSHSWMVAFKCFFPGTNIFKHTRMARALMDIHITSDRVLFPRMTEFFHPENMLCHVEFKGLLSTVNLSEYFQDRKRGKSATKMLFNRGYVSILDFDLIPKDAEHAQVHGIPSFYMFKWTCDEPSYPYYIYDNRRSKFDTTLLEASHMVGTQLKGQGFLAAAAAIIAFMLFVGVLTGIILLILKGVGLITPDQYQKAAPYGNAHSGDKLLATTIKRHYKSKNDPLRGTHVGNAHGLDQGAAALGKIVASATKYLVIEYSNGISVGGWFVSLGGNVFAMPNHYLARGTPVKLRFRNGYDEKFETQIVPWEQVIYIEKPKRDLCFMYLPGIQPFRKLIETHGRRKSEGVPFEAKGISRCDIIEVDGNDHYGPLFTQGGMVSFTKDGTVELTMHGPAGPYIVKDWVEIDSIASDDGDCGFSLISTNSAVQHKYLGINVGGNDTDSFMAPIWIEDFEEIMDKRNGTVHNNNHSAVAHCKAEYVDSYYSSVTPINENPEFGVFKGLSQWSTIDKKHTWSSHTDLSPTIFETGFFEQSTQEIVGKAYPENTSLPAKLDQEAFEQSFRKCEGSKFWFDEEMLDPEVWEGVFTEDVGKIDPRMLNMTEATIGIIEWQNFRSIDLSTSAGYPWKLFGYKRDDLVVRIHANPNVAINHRTVEQLLERAPTETEIIDAPEGSVPGLWIHPALQAAIYHRVHHALNGRIVPAHYLYSLKNEMRPLDKVEKHHTRGFKAGALDHLIFMRMVTGHFVSNYEHKPHGDCAVGIDPQSSDWGRLYHRLVDINEEIEEGDHSAWDIHLNSQTYAPCMCNRWRQFYRKHETDPLYRAFRSAIFSGAVGFVVINNRIYIMLGQHSGQPITSVSNSWWNSATKRSAWKRRSVLGIKPRYEIISFNKACELSTFGDDFLLAVKAVYLDEFNTQHLALILKYLFNQEITTSTKDGAIPITTHISKANYLQRKFVNVNGAILAPLNPESIKQMVRYNAKPSPKSGMTRKQLLVQIAHGAMHEWALHGKETYEKNQDIINRYLSYLNKSFQFSQPYQKIFSEKIRNATS